MITQLSIVHFKAIASATVPLGPITVLVGPNDSGKSTILQALMALSRSGEPARAGEQLLDCRPPLAATDGDVSKNIKIAAEGQVRLKPSDDSPSQPYRYALTFRSRSNELAGEDLQWVGRQMISAGAGRLTKVDGKEFGTAAWEGKCSELSRLANEPDIQPAGTTRRNFEAAAAEVNATLLRLDPRAIARPTQLGAPLLADGSGVVGIVDDLLTSGVGIEQISRVNDTIRTVSPHVKTVAAKLHSGGGKELHFALHSGLVVPASQMSDGVVLIAALVVIALGAGTARLLIEEPENGLHPRQLKVVADAIRAIAENQGTQIVLTTHSPLLLNHFAAEEVVLVTRNESGVRTQRMSDAQGLEDLASEMALGELWYNVGDSKLARPA